MKPRLTTSLLLFAIYSFSPTTLNDCINKDCLQYSQRSASVSLGI